MCRAWKWNGRATLEAHPPRGVDGRPTNATGRRSGAPPRLRRRPGNLAGGVEGGKHGPRACPALRAPHGERRRRSAAAPATRARPPPTSASVAGSGTAAIVIWSHDTLFSTLKLKPGSPASDGVYVTSLNAIAAGKI